jgi:hypothetical protein
MIAKLSPELVRELAKAGDQPLPVEDPQTNRIYVLVDAERYKVVRRSTGPGSWTETKNGRRCGLIHKRFTQGISAAEASELAELQEELASYRKQAVPLPYDIVDALKTALISPATSS